MDENNRARFVRARAELKQDLELYRLLMAYQESSGLEDLDGLARMALAALADSEAEYLKAGAAAGYAESEQASKPLPPPQPQNAAELLIPFAPEPSSRLLRPQPPPEPGGMSTEDLMRLVEEDAGLHHKP